MYVYFNFEKNRHHWIVGYPIYFQTNPMDAFGTGHASGLDSSQHLQGVRLLLIPRQLTAFVDVVHLKMKHGLVEDLDQTRSKCRE